MSGKRTSRLNDNLIVYYLTEGGEGERKRERERRGKKAIDIVDIEHLCTFG